MVAEYWIHEGRCRVIVRNADGQVTDLDDTWNNVASAQCMVRDNYPGIAERVYSKHGGLRDQDKIKALNEEWKTCKTGN